jgi:pimeloyl-ACP methyl ester carboxylesterase
VESCSVLKKIAFLHGFLGSPGDMTPFFIEGAENTSIDLRRLLFEPEPIKKLTEILTDFDILVGYSFGGRLLGEVKKQSGFIDKTWIFVSSRHTPYTVEELEKREEFKNKLGRLIQTNMKKFYDYWNELPLFSGHVMSDFREKYSTAYKPWTEDEMVKYLLDHFNSEQFIPFKDTRVHYIYGGKDEKYSLEAGRLNEIFTVHKLEGLGHRAPFEDVQKFNKLIQEIVGIISDPA